MTAYVDEVDGVFFTDRTAATDEEFRARFDRFGIFDEERVVEEVARAIYEVDPDVTFGDGASVPWDATGEEWREYHRTAARAAVAAYRAMQDGGAEEAAGEYDLATDLANRGLRACCGLPSAEHCR